MNYYYANTHKLFSLILLFFLVAAASVVLAHGDDEETDKNAPQGSIFSALLPDVPGKRMTVYELHLPPSSGRKSIPHHHPGSVYVYVVKGTVRWALKGQPVKILHAGDSFFEPPGVIHTVSENASTTEPATVLAVMLSPDGAPLVTRESGDGK